MKKIFFFPIIFWGFALVAGAQEIQTDSLLVDKNQRTFHYRLPSNHPKENASLIFILHGSGGNGLQMVPYAKKLEEKALAENIILVYPNGYKNFWNECRKASTALANLENINEQSFFKAMIQYFKEKYALNEKQLYAIGFSGGGQMAYKLALTMPGTFQAITSVVANLPTAENMDCSTNPIPVSVLMVNGTADGVCPFEGGEMKTTNLTLGTVKSTMATFTEWAEINHYKRKPRWVKLPDPNLKDSISIEKYSYTGKKTEVVLYKVVNGKHEFPKDLDVLDTSWTFFKKLRSKKRKS